MLKNKGIKKIIRNLIFILFFVFFTYFPPKINYFKDPVNKSYGINLK